MWFSESQQGAILSHRDHSSGNTLVVTTEGEGDEWVEAREAANHPPMPRIGPHDKELAGLK